MHTDPHAGTQAPVSATPATGWSSTPAGAAAPPAAAAVPGGGHATWEPVQHAVAPPIAPTGAPAPSGPMIGKYQPSGDPAIDRMISLERALRQFGAPF